MGDFRVEYFILTIRSNVESIDEIKKGGFQIAEKKTNYGSLKIPVLVPSNGIYSFVMNNYGMVSYDRDFICL